MAHTVCGVVFGSRTAGTSQKPGEQGALTPPRVYVRGQPAFWRHCPQNADAAETTWRQVDVAGPSEIIIHRDRHITHKDKYVSHRHIRQAVPWRQARYSHRCITQPGVLQAHHLETGILQVVTQTASLQTQACHRHITQGQPRYRHRCVTGASQPGGLQAHHWETVSVRTQMHHPKTGSSQAVTQRQACYRHRHVTGA